MKNTAFPLKNFLQISVACLMLTACQTATNTSGKSPDEIDKAIERATEATAKKSGNLGSLSYLESVYKRNSDDPTAALNYARSLRENDYLSRAETVLAPFANDQESSSDLKTEFAAIQLAQGNYKSAEKFAQKAVLQDEKNYQAYQHLGIALDAQGMHKEAERAFRLGLDNWQGDPTSIMNNLALNLASQNYLDEAMEILEKAKAIAPGRIEVERNSRIVAALKESASYNPDDYLKPKAEKTEKVD